MRAPLIGILVFAVVIGFVNAAEAEMLVRVVLAPECRVPSNASSIFIYYEARKIEGIATSIEMPPLETIGHIKIFNGLPSGDRFISDVISSGGSWGKNPAIWRSQFEYQRAFDNFCRRLANISYDVSHRYMFSIGDGLIIGAGIRKGDGFAQNQLWSMSRIKFFAGESNGLLSQPRLASGDAGQNNGENEDPKCGKGGNGITISSKNSTNTADRIRGYIFLIGCGGVLIIAALVLRA